MICACWVITPSSAARPAAVRGFHRCAIAGCSRRGPLETRRCLERRRCCDVWLMHLQVRENAIQCPDQKLHFVPGETAQGREL